VWGAPEQGAADAAWSWRELPGLGGELWGCRGCVMSNGSFAVLGSITNQDDSTSSCEALAIDDGDAHWEPLPPMHDSRSFFACGAVGGCVIVAGGPRLKSTELYDEQVNRWLRLPRDLPYTGEKCGTMVSVGWVARLCRSIARTCSHMNLSFTEA
jgi:hypothetical protein